MKVLSILGTRPDLIKMSEIIKKLDQHTDHIFVHTGQNHAQSLHNVFFSDMGIRQPDYNLGIAGDTLGETLGKLMKETENVIMAERPDAVVILGDTNSSLASIIVKRFKIPLFHLEAGNRSFDDNVPEEINRRIIDHISDINMVYSENARRYLLDEGIAKDRIFVMGSPMKEVLKAQEKNIKSSKILKLLGLKKGHFYLASIHRDENTEIPVNFTNVIYGLNNLARVTNSKIVLSTHPRTMKKLKSEHMELDENVMICTPFSFSDYCKLQMSAACVISDSGTISEESALLNFPAITLRNAIERPEAIDAGSILLSSPHSVHLLEAVSVVSAPNSVPEAYNVDNCSDRVLRAVLGYTGYVNKYVWQK